MFDRFICWLTDPYKGMSRIEYALISVAGILWGCCLAYCIID